MFRDGFLVGSGNALGDGIYFSKDKQTAKSYSGQSGIYLCCRISLGRTCRFDSATSHRYKAWCRAKGVQPDNSAITAFLVQHGFDTIQDGTLLVVLSPQYANPAAWKRKSRNIRILSVHRASDDRRVRV